ncbi:response regulator [Butyrivibrio sp. WCD3002]|uniref:response regulator n=1 Tax=Butyrivibrio sp. WCD3002 TaxID=1280676 RepID=UPI0003FA86D4|nr:response regulator [Butyrivibrio sp. WCD3002]
MKYNIFLELSSIPFDVILCIFFWYKYRDKTKINREFRALSLLVLIGTIVDVIDGVCISYDGMIHPWIMYVVNTMDYVFATWGSYQFVKYVTAYARNEWRNTAGAVINKTAFFIYFALLIQNFFTGTVYRYNAAGHFVPGDFFNIVVYIYPLYFIVFGGIYILSHSEKYAFGMKVSLFVTFVFMVGLYAYQMLVDKYLLVTFFAASAALFTMFLTLETPDYSKLMRTMEELSISKRELEASGIRAAEMSRAKSRFLAQMSNEIRTPVNAIMGYSNLILADTGEDSTREYTQRVKISAKRLLLFFENVLNFVSEEDNNSARRLPSMAELIEKTDEQSFLDDVGTSAHKAVSGASKIRILVVDDAEMNIDLMVRMLRPMGFTVDTATNGKQAILQIRKFHYDLIFMDHLMPVMDGVTALSQLREEKLCEDTPVIMLTANAITGEEEKYLKKGFAAYLTKPFTESSIRDILKRFLPIPESGWNEEADITEWEALQEKLPTVRVADARKHLLHDIALYRQLLFAFAENDVSTELSAAIRKGDYVVCKALIREQRDCAVFLGAESLVKKADRLEALLKKSEFELMRERIGSFVAEKNLLADQIRMIGEDGE